MDLIEPPFELNQITSDIIGAAIEVHRHLGPGYLESAYEEALVIELRLREIVFERQVVVPIRYKDEPIGASRLDLLVDGTVLAQLRSYLKAGAFPVGLLINFKRHGPQTRDPAPSVD